MSISVSPLNDLALEVKLKDISPTTGKLIPLTSGNVTAFFANDSDPETASADTELNISATHVGRGKWLLLWDAATITIARYDALFSNPTPVIVILLPSGFRVYVSITGVRSKPAEEDI
jgi:hypothetical protein